MGAVGQRDAGAGPGDLLDRDHMREVSHPGAAVFLGHGDAQQAQLAQFGPELGGELVAAVDLGGHRLQPFLRPAVHHVAQGIHILAEIELHTCVEHRFPPIY